MALIVNIETATRICSTALASDGKVLSQKESDEGRSHASNLTVFIQELLKERDLRISDIDAVAVSKGPGSYTGLRIGVSTAKGLAYAAGIPLISIDTLAALAAGAARMPAIRQLAGENPAMLLCPMLEARRMEVYTALFTLDGNVREQANARIIDRDSYGEILKNHAIAFFGEGSGKCRDTLKQANAHFFEEINCSAGFMAGLSEKKFKQKHFENVAYFEPFYLKDFIATIPGNKGLR